MYVNSICICKWASISCWEDSLALFIGIQAAGPNYTATFLSDWKMPSTAVTAVGLTSCRHKRSLPSRNSGNFRAELCKCGEIFGMNGNRISRIKTESFLIAKIYMFSSWSSGLNSMCDWFPSVLFENRVRATTIGRGKGTMHTGRKGWHRARNIFRGTRSKCKFAPVRYRLNQSETCSSYCQNVSAETFPSIGIFVERQ